MPLSKCHGPAFLAGMHLYPEVHRIASAFSLYHLYSFLQFYRAVQLCLRILLYLHPTAEGMNQKNLSTVPCFHSLLVFESRSRHANHAHQRFRTVERSRGSISAGVVLVANSSNLGHGRARSGKGGKSLEVAPAYAIEPALLYAKQLSQWGPFTKTDDGTRKRDPRPKPYRRIVPASRCDRRHAHALRSRPIRCGQQPGHRILRPSRRPREIQPGELQRPA